jgi:hypothetical protein
VKSARPRRQFSPRLTTMPVWATARIPIVAVTGKPKAMLEF